MKNILLLSFLLTAAGAAVAAPLTPEEALARAIPAINKAAPRVASADKWDLAYTAKAHDHNEANGCYLFKSHTGFIVTSADDRARPLLGYSQDPQFDEKGMSPEFRWFLDEYANEIHSADDNTASGDETAIVTPTGDIAPMCATHWNQFGPYNDMCPLVHGHKVVTGCVATALAQVMKYHNWPEKGTGSHSYRLYGEEISCDYGDVTFDWDAMTDNYGRHSTARERDAVAQLMFACGVAVDMHYAPGGSGASTGALPWTMRENFDYAPTAYNARRPYYDLQDWNALIYNSLKNNGPVQYSGFEGNGEGHSFVCDGYEGKGYFHINWGWGGADDGYYLLTALRPEHHKTAVSQGWGGFNFNQSAIVDLKPYDGQEKADQVVIVCTDGFHVAQRWSPVGREVTVRGGFWNDGANVLVGQFGLRAVSEKGDTIYLPGREMRHFQGGRVVGAYPVRLTDNLEVGKYTLTPVFSTDGKWHVFPTSINSPQNEEMEIFMRDGKKHAHFLGTESGSKIQAIDLQVDGKLAPKRNFRVTALLENTGNQEWAGPVKVGVFTDKGELIATTEPVMVDLPAGTDLHFDLTTRLSVIHKPDLLVDGPVEVYLLHNNNAHISAGLSADMESTGTDLSAVKAVEAPSASLNGIVEAYTLTGNLAAKGRLEDVRGSLPAGIYIITDAQGHTMKQLVR